MKKRIVWLVVSCLMVLALLVTSCAKAEEKATAPAVKETAPAVKETAPAVKEAAPAAKEAAPAAGAEMLKVTLTKVDGTKVEKLVEKPKYGGVLIVSYGFPILGWDEINSPSWTLSYTLDHTNQDLLIGDWARGPAGTGEMTWQYGDYISMKNATGELAESWELAGTDTIIYHIRKGVRWHNKPPVNGRELTADDVVFNLKRIYIDTPTSTWYGMLGAGRPTEVYATDKYTVVMKAPATTIGDTLITVSDNTKMFPPEVIKKYGDHNQWEYVTGTGPFILTDYIPMSSAVWKRNPDYWEYDPVLGKDYPLPYLDGLKILIIPDLSTDMAAVRTGKIDVPYTMYARTYFDQVVRTRPDLKYSRISPYACTLMGLTQGRGLPFDDIRVRKALLMGIDDFTILKTYYLDDGKVLTYPVPEGSPDVARWCTPFEQLPPEIKEMHTYNPEKAKQLLTEAGYPNGFKTEVVVNAASAEYMDLMQMVKEYWRKIGIDLFIDAKEYGPWTSMYQRKTYKEMLIYGRARNIPSMYNERKGNMYNWAMIDDPKIEQYYQDIGAAFFDEPKRDKLVKEYALYALSQGWYYFPPRPYTYKVWQPWVKNYYGAYAPGPYNWGRTIRYFWLDQELKKAMGY